MNRKKNLESLKSEEFDICIIGGGASGAGCALDAVLRGYKVALIEKKDFASETSSKSTKLIHGGVRYLEQAFKNLDFAQLKQVRHGLAERHTVIRNAPHLAHPLALITPVSSWIEGLYFTIGLKLYGWFARHDSLPTSQWLNKDETLRRIPTLNTQNLHSSVMYYDGQLDDARYCLALIQSASEAGAIVVNHTEMSDFHKDSSGKIISMNVKDSLSEEEFNIKSKVFINCTGPFADSIRLKANPEIGSRIRPSKGVHLVLPLEILDSRDAMLIPKTPDGRVVFAIPFEGKMLLGTTDNDYEDLSIEPTLGEEEIDFLLETLQPYLAKKLDKNDIRSGFGGLRPLISAPDSNATKGLLRDHEVEHDSTSNLVSLLGGKWTTYRIMAKDTIDFVGKILEKNIECTTEMHYLVGGEGYNFDDWQKLQTEYNLAADTCQHLLKKYGNRAENVAKLVVENPDFAEKLHVRYPFIKAEVIYQIRNEMACLPRDVLARRMRLEMIDWRIALQVLLDVGDIMAKEIGWTKSQRTDYIVDYQLLVIRLIPARY